MEGLICICPISYSLHKAFAIYQIKDSDVNIWADTVYTHTQKLLVKKVKFAGEQSNGAGKPSFSIGNCVWI